MARAQQEVTQYHPGTIDLLRPQRAKRLRELERHRSVLLLPRARLAEECGRERPRYQRRSACIELFKRPKDQSDWLPNEDFRLVLRQQAAHIGSHRIAANVPNHNNALDLGRHKPGPPASARLARGT